MAELPPKYQNDLETYFTLKRLLGLCVNEDQQFSNQYDESPVSTPSFHQVTLQQQNCIYENNGSIQENMFEDPILCRRSRNNSEIYFFGPTLVKENDFMIVLCQIFPLCEKWRGEDENLKHTSRILFNMSKEIQMM